MTPLLVEDRTDDIGRYTEIWLCEPLRVGISYRVIEDSWNEDFAERTIHKVELLS